MKKTFFLLLILVSFFKINAQNKTIPGSFVIKDLEDESKIEMYTKAVENTSFEEYRLKDKSVVLEFRNGFSLLLLSAEELKLKGFNIDVTKYQDKVVDGYLYPKFKFAEDGTLVTMHQTQPTKQQQKLSLVK